MRSCAPLSSTWLAFKVADQSDMVDAGRGVTAMPCRSIMLRTRSAQVLRHLLGALVCPLAVLGAPACTPALATPAPFEAQLSMRSSLDASVGSSRSAIECPPAAILGRWRDQGGRVNADERDRALSMPQGRESSEGCARPTGWRRFVCDSRALGGRLLLRGSGDPARALGTLATAAVLFAERKEIQDYAQDHRSSSRTRLYDAGRNLGKGAATPVFAAGFYLAGKLAHDSYQTETAQVMLESTLYAGLLAVSGQLVLASDRPRVGDRVRFFHGGGHGVSGDVAIAASVVAPLDRRYLRWRDEDSPGTKILKTAGRSALYTALALTAFQRIDAGAHWAPDVFLGAAAGLTAGYSICSEHETARETAQGARPDPVRPSLVPIPGGFALQWSF